MPNAPLSSPAARKLALRPSEVALGILFALWAGTLFAVYQPGIASLDSIEMYRQGVERQFGSGSPPILPLLFLIGAWLTGSAWPVLLLHLALVGGGFWLLSRTTDERRAWLGVAALAVALLAPTTWTLAVVLWKDVTMAAAFLAAVVLLHRGRPLAAFIATALAVMSRYNAIFGAVPLLIPITAQLPWLRGWPRRSAGALAGLALLGASPKIVEQGLGASNNWMLGSLLLYDIAGVYAAHPQEFAQSPLNTELSIDDITACYNPNSVNCLLYSMAPGRRSIWPDKLPALQPTLVAEWTGNLKRHPETYLAHRLRVFRTLLGADGRPVYYAYQPRTEPNPYGVKLTRDHTMAYRLLDRVRGAAWNTILFRGWFWLLLAAALAGVAIWRRGPESVAFAAAASGITYALGYLPVSLAGDFRYLYWTALAALAALVLLVAHGRPHPASADAPPPQPGS